MKRNYQQIALSVLAVWAAACGSSSNTPPTVDAGPPRDPSCNALGGPGCVLPLPSSIYEKDDPTTATGVRVDFAEGTLPKPLGGAPMAAAYYNNRDGFSANAPIIIAFAEGVDGSNLPPITDPGQSLDPSSPTILIDLATNERIPHFAELDSQATDPADQALIIRPMIRLTSKHTYAVGITTALKSASGKALKRSDGFQAIVDGTTTTNPRLERIRGRFPAIFTGLAAAGAAKTDLVVAWDFTVTSDETVNADLTNARDVMLAAAGDKGENLTFVVEKDNAGDDPTLIARYLEGHFDIPQVLTGDAGDDSTLARGADGKPIVVGTYSAKFYAEVPVCAAAQKPLPVVIYGHGLLGAGDEITSHNVEFFANHLCAVVIATDWRGMASIDLGAVAQALVDADLFPKVVDHLVQGMIDFIALEQIVRGPMANSAIFTDHGTPLIDPTRVYYYGNSQGGIYGGTVMAYDPFITRGVLGVVGANYATLLERSADWPDYHGLQRNAYPGALDNEILLNMFQLDWDRVDPISTTAGLIGLNGTPIANTPPKQILMIEAHNDSQVPNIGTEAQARTMKIPLLGPAVVTPYGMTPTPGPLQSALTIYDEHKLPTPPLTNSALEDNGTHGSVRGRQATQDQMKTFLETGNIIQTCVDGGGTPVGCDCPTDAICGPSI